MKAKLSLFFLFFVCLELAAQAPYGVGQWKYHFPFHNGEHITASASTVYLANSNSLFSLDIANNNIETLSKLDGLAGNDFTAIAYNDKDQSLYIGYASGRVDIVSDNEIIHLIDLFRNDNPNSKNINHFTFRDDLVYIASDFGIVVYNQKLREVKETYKTIGPAGQEVQASKTIILPNNTIYCLTQLGLLSASTSGSNLLDFNSWTLNDASFGIDPSWVVVDISYFDNNTVLLTTKDNGLFQYTTGPTWNLVPAIPLGTGEQHRLQKTGTSILLIEPTAVTTIKADLSFTITPMEKSVSDACIQGNQLWLSTRSHGLGKYSPSNTLYYAPNGPPSSNAFDYGTYGDTFYALPGNINNLNTEGYYLYKDFTWSQAPVPTPYNLPSIGKMQVQQSTGRKYFASQNYGLLYQEADGSFGLINDTSKILSEGQWINSPIPFFTPRTRVMGLDVDLNDNLWFVTYGISNDYNLFCITNNKRFLAFKVPNPAMALANDLQCDRAGNIWIQSQSSILVFQPSSGAYKVLGSSFFNQATPTCMAIDKLGDLWVGTTKGIQILYDPTQVTRTDDYEPSYPFYGSQPLLIEEAINHIYVAGGNNKWISTDQGAWLVNQDGSDIIENFTSENSNLPADNVLRIGINDHTGEVFFTLETGMVSYWGDAIAGESTHNAVKIFPNPVAPDFTGEVGITGLAENAIVKITDVAGRLVRELYANGGMVTWDVKNVHGAKVSSGVYLIFSTDAEGNDTFVGKIVVIE